MNQEFDSRLPTIQKNLDNEKFQEKLEKRGGYASGYLMSQGSQIIQEGSKEGAKTFLKEEISGASRKIIFDY